MDVSASPENGNRCRFRSIVLSSVLEYRTMDKIKKRSNSELHQSLNILIKSFIAHIHLVKMKILPLIFELVPLVIFSLQFLKVREANNINLKNSTKNLEAILLNRYLSCRVTIWSGLKLLYLTVLRVFWSQGPRGERGAEEMACCLAEYVVEGALHSSGICYLNDYGVAQ